MILYLENNTTIDFTLHKGDQVLDPRSGKEDIILDWVEHKHNINVKLKNSGYILGSVLQKYHNHRKNLQAGFKLTQNLNQSSISLSSLSESDFQLIKRAAHSINLSLESFILSSAISSAELIIKSRN